MEALGAWPPISTRQEPQVDPQPIDTISLRSGECYGDRIKLNRSCGGRCKFATSISMRRCSEDFAQFIGTVRGTRGTSWTRDVTKCGSQNARSTEPAGITGHIFALARWAAEGLKRQVRERLFSERTKNGFLYAGSRSAFARSILVSAVGGAARGYTANLSEILVRLTGRNASISTRGRPGCQTQRIDNHTVCLTLGNVALLLRGKILRSFPPQNQIASVAVHVVRKTRSSIWSTVS
jgi:hypothetical protein